MTPTATATFLAANSTPEANGLVLENPAVTGTIRNYQAPYLQTLANEKYAPNELNQVGSTIRYTIQTSNGKFPLLWAHGWCAKTKDILVQNLKVIHYELRVNGNTVDLSSALQQDYQRGPDQYCHGTWIAIYGWPIGTTTLEEKTVLSEAINDGSTDFPAGTIAVIYTVTVDQSANGNTQTPEETLTPINATQGTP